MSTALLQRETFVTSRLLDFFSEKELTAQIGHGPKDWPLVFLKESIDNGLDACEDARIEPKIHVEVGNDHLSVIDNGPGIRPETVAGVLDFMVRVSSREAYVSPCRGAQGNALKTLIAMPFVLNGDSGTVEIESSGILHRIITRVDRIVQIPILEHKPGPSPLVKNGTRITMFTLLNPEDDAARFLQVLQGFAFTNPHLQLAADIFGTHHEWSATTRDWQKWFPSDLPPAHWYGPEQFERLVTAYLAKRKDMTVREFLLRFRGMSSTAKQKQVLEETRLSRQYLQGLVVDGALNRYQVAELLTSMQQHSKPVKPETLGFIGREHLASRMEALGAQMKTFEYDRQKGETADGIPWNIETAFASLVSSHEADDRTIITGVNWSPGILNPFRQLGHGDGLDATLQDLRVGSDEPVIVFVHMACARVEYTDRGKSAVLLED